MSKAFWNLSFCRRLSYLNQFLLYIRHKFISHLGKNTIKKNVLFGGLLLFFLYSRRFSAPEQLKRPKPLWVSMDLNEKPSECRQQPIIDHVDSIPMTEVGELIAHCKNGLEYRPLFGCRAIIHNRASGR